MMSQFWRWCQRNLQKSWIPKTHYFLSIVVVVFELMYAILLFPETISNFGLFVSFQSIMLFYFEAIYLNISSLCIIFIAKMHIVHINSICKTCLKHCIPSSMLLFNLELLKKEEMNRNGDIFLKKFNQINQSIQTFESQFLFVFSWISFRSDLL